MAELGGGGDQIMPTTLLLAPQDFQNFHHPCGAVFMGFNNGQF
jgi:hypothetical protein